MNWPTDRIEELEELEDLLYCFSNLNNSSNFIANVTVVIGRTKQLISTDLKSERKSFVNFLKEQAIQ